MTIGELIEQLERLDSEMIVCLSDWNEMYTIPSEGAAEILEVVEEEYRDKNDKEVLGQFLRIGGWY